MQTPTHFLMTAALRYPLQKQAIPVHKVALLVGSVLPDLPFGLLSLVYGLFYRVAGKPESAETIIDHLHSLFFTDPVWIAAHNAPHSLVVNGVLIGLGGIGYGGAAVHLDSRYSGWQSPCNCTPSSTFSRITVTGRSSSFRSTGRTAFIRLSAIGNLAGGLLFLSIC